MIRNIVICCDGTGNDFGENNTNVVKAYQALDLSDPTLFSVRVIIGFASRL